MKCKRMGIGIGLALFAASALSAPVPAAQMLQTNPITFTTYMTPVTDVTTPDWARLPDVLAWWELMVGSCQNGNSALVIYLRGVMKKTAGEISIVQWLERIPTFGGADTGDPSGSPNPEPGTLLLLGAGGALLGLRRYRCSK